ncbi:DUF1800 domain-containing protein [Variovorax sp. PCZ-1]|uniref:DUF1800 domain-containing protein n=1 Tax=Variovorax sp. PCZ-1 TaxID=2835533 RepID=UPI001BD0CA72|nr:DUF1800 domain-containing protein [Variovorax sp. PCZ-1]MBS7807887.1 DUF1800 domain-containing protein [Variovorax sp. PCZ-1]
MTNLAEHNPTVIAREDDIQTTGPNAANIPVQIIPASTADPVPWAWPAGLTAFLTACGGGGGGSSTNNATVPNTFQAINLPGSGGSPPPKVAVDQQPNATDAARFLTQASFGMQSTQDVQTVREKGYPLWLWEQINTGTMLHTSYLDQQKLRNVNDQGKANETEEMSYEAIWQQWLYGADQLRGRMSFALSQILVISNVAPDIRPYAMSSYMDMLNRNAFGNFRQLLEDVTLHPAMGYYLNMLNSEKDDPATGAHPNENYAREVLQLFSIGLVKLNLDGSQQLDSAGKPIPSYDESIVQGFAKAFTGWTYPNATGWDEADEEVAAAWTSAMMPFSNKHSSGEKKLLNGMVLASGGTPQTDMKAALDSIFNHPNVGPFISRQLIQRLVTSNPSRAYISRVASIFNNNGSGVRGDLRAVVAAILLDTEARNAVPPANFGKQREPVMRFANFLRALNAKADNGRNAIHYLESADNGLGQSPLLSPSVFNFFSPNFRPAGKIAAAGLVAPEFQITTETTVVGGLNFFANLFNNGGYGYEENKLKLNTAPLEAKAGDANALIADLNMLFCNGQMSTTLQTRLRTMINAININDKPYRVKASLILISLSPDFVIQR